MVDVIYQADLEVAVTAQVRFLEKLLRRWLISSGSLSGSIKFLYRIEFQQGTVVYVGTGSAARLSSRVSGKVLQYDNSDLIAHAAAAMEPGRERKLICAGLFQVAYPNDSGPDFERFEKSRCMDAGLTLINRYDLYRPVGDYKLISRQIWLDEAEMCLYRQLGSGDISLSDVLHLLAEKKARFPDGGAVSFC